MAYALPSEGALDYFPCRYGASSLMFRGPRRALDRPYVAFFGGNETSGKFIPDPFPDLVEEETGLGAVNLGCSNAGIDLYLNDPALLAIAAGAEAVVLQVLGAANLSNRYYAVHPRRNDRFLGPTPLLKTLYRDVDFTEFAFTRHLLLTLQAQSPDRFEVLADELRTTWLARMQDLLGHLHARTLLVWVADAPPTPPTRRASLQHDPILIDSEMVAAVRPLARTYVESLTAPQAMGDNLDSMSFSPDEAAAAARLPGPQAHRSLARLLSQALENALRPDAGPQAAPKGQASG
jgi:hypothetical protein